ncbi:hypothetical protein FE782_07135 [Paenibacillus antri]|uniref:Uncharacterized protein n=1 Tax=Paenibacillus antri TaxID=2582848 RepID=A0A5R9GBL3_9BACL|nr:hypothetical protein [Paenibacillus antri]TLS53131.1 hypothetical protein FE782_07135 [Paenibacillus antri]
MKLRLLPVVITIVVSSGVLFGGWFAYESIAMEDPFLEKVAAVEGIADPVVEIERERAIVRATIEPGASLRQAYRGIVEAGASSLGDRDIVVEASGETSEKLEDWWSEALFDVAQAMETKQYSLIPQRLRELAKADGSLQVQTEMDEKNVYITLVDGPNSKHVVLPRQPAIMGVWPNE